MYAIIKTGGKQYRVKKDDVIDVERLNADIGSQVKFEEVLLMNDGSNLHFGEPSITGSSVTAEVIGDAVGPKIHSQKYQPRENQRTRWGHRQHYTRVKILEISGAKGEQKAKASPKKAAAETTKESKPKAEPKAKAEKKPKSTKTTAAPKRKTKAKE